MTEDLRPWIGVLGPLRVTRRGEDVPISRGTPALLLTALTAQSTPVTTAELVEIVGQERSKEISVATVHTAIWRLRTQLGDDVVVATDDGYLLDRERCRIDADEMADEIERARELLDVGQPGAAAEAFAEALAMWRGAPLGALKVSSFGEAARRRVLELHALATEEHGASLRASGAPRDAIRVIEALVREHSLREHAWALLVGAYLDAGLPDDARAAYDRARMVLADFGVSPGRELESAIAPADVASIGFAGTAAPTLSPLVPLARHAELVGHRSDLGVLEAAVAEALQGGGATFIPLTGTAGVGKTRLAAEVAASAHQRGASVWFEICESNAVSVLAPLGYWARRVLAEVPEAAARLAESGPLAPLLRPDVAPRPVEDEGREQLQQFEAVARLFEAVGRPAVLVLDDAHNVPAETLRCLAHLLRTRPDLRLAVLATLRPGAASDEAVVAMAELQRLPSVRPAIAVEELDEDDAITLFRSLSSGHPGGHLPGEERLYAATGGNAALIVAVAAAPDHLTTSASASLPGGLLDATVRSMTEQLDPRQREVLELLAAAAVVRPFVPVAVVEAALPHLSGATDVEAGVRAAERAGLLSADDQRGVAIFRHEMVRDLVYGAIPADRRRALHRAVGRALDEPRSGASPDVDAVADHYERAWPLCSAEEIAPPALQAATQALQMLHVDRAIALARLALEHLSSEPGHASTRSQGELLTLLAGGYAELGEVASSMEAYRQAAALAAANGWPDLEAVARTHSLQMRASRPGPDDPDIVGMRRLLESATDLDDVLVAEGLVYLLAADPLGSMAPVDALLADADRRGDRHLQLKVIQELTWSTPLDQREQYHQAYAEIASSLGEPGPLARVGLHAWMADIEHGRSAFDLPWEPIGRLVREAGEPLLTYDWRVWRATLVTNQGSWDEAGRLIEAARTTRFALPLRGAWTQERPAYISAVQAVQLGSILYERGEMELLHAVGSQFPIDVLIRCSVDSRAMRARAAAEVGHPSAYELCDEMIEEPHIDGPQTADWLAVMTYLASACGVCGHRRGAELCLERLTPHLERHTLVSWTQYIGAVRHNVSFIYQLLGDLDAAVECLEIATAQYDAMAARPFATLGRLHLSQVLAQRDRSPDRREAELLRARVVQDATALDMTGVLRSLQDATRRGLRPVARHRAAGTLLDALGEDGGE